MGSNPTLSAKHLPIRHNENPGHGEMTEWLKVHAWKACVRQRTVGSNPTLSARIVEHRSFWGPSPVHCDIVNPARPGREQR